MTPHGKLGKWCVGGFPFFECHSCDLNSTWSVCAWELTFEYRAPRAQITSRFEDFVTRVLALESLAAHMKRSLFDFLLAM